MNELILIVHKCYTFIGFVDNESAFDVDLLTLSTRIGTYRTVHLSTEFLNILFLEF